MTFPTGFAGGAFALAAPLYIVEIAEPSMRGALASTMQLMVTFGIFFVNGLSIHSFLHWNIISAICCSIPGTENIKKTLLEKYCIYFFHSHLSPLNVLHARVSIFSAIEQQREPSKVILDLAQRGKL